MGAKSTHGSSSPLVDSDSSLQDSFHTPPHSSVLAHILTEQAPTLKYSHSLRPSSFGHEYTSDICSASSIG